MSEHYILQSHDAVPVHDFDAWARWFETADRRVAYDELPNGYVVSTVFLGLDHNFAGGIPHRPLLFETMVFTSRWVHDDLDMGRYSTWAEAETGHAAMVARWRLRDADDARDDAR